MHESHRKITVVTVCMLLLGAIAVTFWQQDWQYSLPTPRPKALVQPPVGARLRLAGVSTPLFVKSACQPVFLNFFNPDCPCSRFNLSHVRDLVKTYRPQIRFIAIVQGNDSASLEKSLRQCQLPMQVVIDRNGAIAKACGVYSTPQAVILDRQGQLYYRGNYNASRYCEDPATDFARISMDALLAGRPAPHLPRGAVVAYGCALPSNRIGML